MNTIQTKALRKLTIKVNNISFPRTELCVNLHKQSAWHITAAGGQRVPIKSNSILEAPSEHVISMSNATDTVRAVAHIMCTSTRQPGKEFHFLFTFKLNLRGLLFSFFIQNNP
jgi:hypothetical protein